MARRCDICGKRAQVGYKISHSHRKTKKKWLPNIQTVRIKENDTIKRIHVCTSCLRSGKVNKIV